MGITRIATFNVNGVNGRLPVLLRWLAETPCDIVCLQELKTSDEKFPAEAIRAAGYGAVWHGQKSYNGVAILARGVEPVERRRGLPGDPDDTHSLSDMPAAELKDIEDFLVAYQAADGKKAKVVGRLNRTEAVSLVRKAAQP